MSKNAPRIIVVGSTNTDLVVSVPHIPAPGETILGGDLATLSGGKGANQAVAAARLGGQVTFLARVGDDAFGERAVASLEADGIDTRFVFRTPGVSSGVALIAVDAATGQNSIVVAPGANARLSPADLESAAEAFDSAHAVVLSLEIPLETVQHAAEMAHERGIPVILNPAPAQLLPPALLKNISICTPNEQEAQQILDRPAPFGDLAAFAELRGLVATTVVTVGAKGAVLVSSDSDPVLIPTVRVVAVDTVAAGDCFTGALAVRTAEGAALPEAVGFANAAAALSVTRRGAQSSLPTRAEAEAFLAASV